MVPRNVHLWNALRLQRDYVAAQRQLIDKLAAAPTAAPDKWPTPEENEGVACLGRLASAELQAYLKDLRRTRAGSRIGRIQRLSANERQWQPSPELWLSRQNCAGPATGSCAT